MTVDIGTLDLSGVTNANYMFFNAKISRLVSVVNSDGILHAQHMFEKCTFAALPKMSLKGLSGKLTLFYNAYNPKDLPEIVFYSAINLPNVNDIDSIHEFLYDLLGDRYVSSYGYGGWSSTWSEGILEKWAKSLCTNSFEELKAQLKNLQTDKNGYVIIKSVNVLLELLTANSNNLQ